MEKPKAPDTLPEQFQLSWRERILSLPFWEYAIENKGIVAAISLVIVSSFVGLGIYLSKHQASSIAQMFKAQHLAKELKSIDNPSADKKETLTKLEEIVSVQPDASAFAGTVAQEQLIQKVEPPTLYCFETARTELQNNGLAIQGCIDKLSLLYAQGKKEEVLVELDSVLQQIEKSETSCQAPNAYAYLLLQKATILKELHRSPNTTIDEFELTLSTYPEVNANFERTCAGNVKELISFLREPFS
jgi:hypothetical protein